MGVKNTLYYHHSPIQSAYYVPISIIIIYLYFYGMATYVYSYIQVVIWPCCPDECGTFHLIPLNASKIFK